MTTAEQIAKMTPAEALALRNRMDKTPANQLPGAHAVGATRARRAYALARTLLTARIDCP